MEQRTNFSNSFCLCLSQPHVTSFRVSSLLHSGSARSVQLGARPHDVTHYIPYRNMFLLPKSFFLTRKLMTTSSLSFSFRKGTHRWSGWPAWDHTAQRSHVGESKSSAFCLEGVTDPRNTPSFWRIGPRGALQDQLAMPWFSLACLQRVSGWSGFSDTHPPHPGISCIISGHYPSERWNWKGQV